MLKNQCKVKGRGWAVAVRAQVWDFVFPKLVTCLM
ncbi:unnamed protein product [Lactuca saligna]|uniref:Uncharacterized protein n=1 Tax=Lactuca saligna TaxID=75948 RepID=A0AA35VEU6_LACSI|nr:unnamed protein product [Lactuca saligna]